jgi:hypothetical protein
MRLDDLRLELLADHEVLRSQLAYIQRLARSVELEQNVPDSDERLRRQLEQLRASLEEHIAREDPVLGPLIATASAWAPGGAQGAQRWHTAQHSVLFDLLDQAAEEGTPRHRALAARLMARELAAHMDDEEEYLLHPDVFIDGVQSEQARPD